MMNKGIHYTQAIIAVVTQLLDRRLVIATEGQSCELRDVVGIRVPTTSLLEYHWKYIMPEELPKCNNRRAWKVRTGQLAVGKLARRKLKRESSQEFGRG